MKIFKAFGKSGTATGHSVKTAALAYFEKFPKSRKCDVREGVQDGQFFTLSLSVGCKSSTIYGITKKQADAMDD